MSKKLTATLVLDLIAGVLAALNAKLNLQIPAEVLATWAGAAGATTVWYLQKQGVLDKAVAGAGALVLCAFTLAGCGTIAKEYVAADRAMYEAVAPEHAKYVSEDGTLSDEDKKLRLATLDAWRYRLEQAEKAGE